MLDRHLIDQRIGSCGCPEEVWMIGNLEVTLHFETENGKQFADVFVDGGEWDVENRHAGDPDTAREEAFRFIETFPAET